MALEISLGTAVMMTPYTVHEIQKLRMPLFKQYNTSNFSKLEECPSVCKNYTG